MLRSVQKVCETVTSPGDLRRNQMHHIAITHFRVSPQINTLIYYDIDMRNIACMF